MTLELSTTSSWVTSFFDSDGVTPLVDTNEMEILTLLN